MSQLFDVELIQFVKIKNPDEIEEYFGCLEREELTFYNEFVKAHHLFECVDDACIEINLSDRALNHLSTHECDRRDSQSALDKLWPKLNLLLVDSNLFQWKLKIYIPSR